MGVNVGGGLLEVIHTERTANVPRYVANRSCKLHANR